MTSGGAFLDHVKWDDLRIALALARAGSVRSAARVLGVSHSTVLRRLRSLEAAAGVRLFELRPEGYELTPAGQDVYDTALELEETLVGLGRRVAGADSSLSGPVRVTVPDPFARLLLPLLREFALEHPRIDVTTVLGTSFVDMAHREADIAVRVASDPPPDLVGHRICTAAVGIYGSKNYLRGRSTRRLDALDWIGWAADSQMFFAQWTRENVPPERVVLRVSAGWGLGEALDADTGVAILPCALGGSRPNWRRIQVVESAGVPLWVLTHRDLRTMARVRVLRDCLVAGLRERKALIEGRTAATPRD